MLKLLEINLHIVWSSMVMIDWRSLQILSGLLEWKYSQEALIIANGRKKTLTLNVIIKKKDDIIPRLHCDIGTSKSVSGRLRIIMAKSCRKRNWIEARRKYSRSNACTTTLVLWRGFKPLNPIAKPKCSPTRLPWASYFEVLTFHLQSAEGSRAAGVQFLGQKCKLWITLFRPKWWTFLWTMMIVVQNPPFEASQQAELTMRARFQCQFR